MKRFLGRHKGLVVLLLTFVCAVTLIFSDFRFYLFGAEGQFQKKVETEEPLLNQQLDGSLSAYLDVWGLLDQQNVPLTQWGGMQIVEMQGELIYYDMLQQINRGTALENGVIQSNGLPDEENLSLQYYFRFQSIKTPQGFSILSPFPLELIPKDFFVHTNGRQPPENIPDNQCIFFHLGKQEFLGKINSISFAGDRLDHLTLLVEVEVFPQPTDFKEFILDTGADQIEVEFRNLYYSEYRVDGLLRRAMS